MNDDLNRLIHTNAHNAYEVGARTERERIIRLVETVIRDDEGDLDRVIALIKGEQK